MKKNIKFNNVNVRILELLEVFLKDNMPDLVERLNCFIKDIEIKFYQIKVVAGFNNFSFAETIKNKADFIKRVTKRIDDYED